MLNEETKWKLRIMNMNPVIDIVDQQDSDVQTVALPFEQRFQRIVDFLYQDKYDEKVQRLIKSAHLRFPKADIHDIYYSPKRRINRDCSLLTHTTNRAQTLAVCCRPASCSR